MRADYFMMRITFDALGTGIPVGNVTGRGKHVDSVIGDALDEHAKPLFALAQGFLSGLALGDIPCDFGKADQLARIITNRIDDNAGPKARAVLAHPPAFGFKFSFVERSLQ